MKVYKIIIIIFVVSISNQLFGQEQDGKLGFYFQPEYSAMFLEGHIGNAVGFGIGITNKNKKWDLGIRYYGRSGPINLHQEYELVLPTGTTYKDKSSLFLGNDHAYLGVEVAYNLRLNNERIMLRFPLSFGQFGAGFYMKDEDRVTPDGRRVNEWEDELQGGTDAGFALATEFGAQFIYQILPNNKHIHLALGATYMNSYGYKSFLGGKDFYNNKLRTSIGVRVGF